MFDDLRRVERVERLNRAGDFHEARGGVEFARPRAVLDGHGGVARAVHRGRRDALPIGHINFGHPRRRLRGDAVEVHHARLARD